MAATNQKFLNISFALDDGEVVVIMTLPIRPEELTRTEPSRVSVVNSLDGAWVDDFGRGLSDISISGHTGWGAGRRPDGASQFSMLRDQFIHRWRVSRKDRIDRGLDPNDVRLIFIDALNGAYVADVVPTRFTLRRSKSQPLLMLYNISLTVVKEDAKVPEDWLLESIDPNDKASASVTSAKASIKLLGDITKKLGDLTKSLGAFGASLTKMVNETVAPALKVAGEIMAAANAARRTLDAGEKVAIDLATQLSGTAKTMFDAAAAVVSLPDYARSKLMQATGAFSNLNCTLSNGFQDALKRTVNYADMKGASNCSSTSGGSAASPYSLEGTNAFESLVPAVPRLLATPEAVAAMDMVKAYDITGPIDTAFLQRSAAAINAGVTIA